MKPISIFVLVNLALIPAAHAASFDCQRSTSPPEKTICADPELSALDETLAQNYGDAMNQLSADGRIILRDGQRRWIRYVTNVCTVYKDNTDLSTCVKQMYSQRIRDMSAAAAQIGPFVFSRIDYFFAQPDDQFGRPYQGQTSFPRIDSPMSDVTAKWNKLMATRDAAEGEGFCDGEPGDVNSGFLIKSATMTTISSQVGNGFYCHGTPHGYGATKGVTYILFPEPHRLTALDLFDRNKHWADFLTEKSSAQLERTIKPNDAKIELDKQRIQGIVTTPDAWSLTKDGLLITINRGEVLANVFGDIEVAIPWDELQPFLAPTAPIQ
jgi:uncharacterized protein